MRKHFPSTAQHKKYMQIDFPSITVINIINTCINTCKNTYLLLCIRVARFSTFFSDRLGTNGESCVPMPVKEPYNLFDLG